MRVETGATVAALSTVRAKAKTTVAAEVAGKKNAGGAVPPACPYELRLSLAPRPCHSGLRLIDSSQRL